MPTDLSLLDVLWALLTLLLLVALGVAVSRQGARTTTAVVLGVVGWLAVTALLAHSGVLATPGLPPRPLLLPLVTMGLLLLSWRTRTVRELLAQTPLWLLVAAQSYRIAVELLLWGLWQAGRAPVQVTFEGRNFDILVGLTAPLVALALARGRLSMRGLVLWNGAGLLLLANIIATAATSAPGPLHRDWPGEPFTALFTWPVVWLPAFIAPFAVFLHVFSLRQAWARARG